MNMIGRLTAPACSGTIGPAARTVRPAAIAIAALRPNIPLPLIGPSDGVVVAPTSPPVNRAGPHPERRKAATIVSFCPKGKTALPFGDAPSGRPTAGLPKKLPKTTIIVVPDSVLTSSPLYVRIRGRPFFTVRVVGGRWRRGRESTSR